MRLILMLGIFWANNLFAQKTLYSFDTSISLPFRSLPHSGKLDQNLKSVIDEQRIYFIANPESSAPGHFYTIDLKNYKIDSFKIIDSYKYGIEKEYWFDLCLHDGDFFLLTDLNIFRFSPSGKEYKVSEIYPVQSPYRYISSLGKNSLMLAEYYNHSPDLGYKACISTFTLSTYMYEDYFPQVDHVGLSHYGAYRRVSSFHGKIYYFDLNAYQIYELDSNLKTQKTIINEKRSSWRYLDSKTAQEIRAIGDNGIEIIRYLNNANIRFSHINHMSFLNDSVMIVGLTNYSKKNQALKTWETWAYDKISATWKLRYSGISDNSKVLKKFSKENYPLELVGNQILFNSSRIVRVTYSSGLSGLGLTEKEYNQQIDEYYEKNSARLVFTVFKHSFIQ